MNDELEPIRLIIPGVPTAWSAPFISRKHAINPRYREKDKAIYELKKQYMDTPIKTQVSVAIEFLMPIPGSTSKKMTLKMIKEVVHHAKRPDIDNCCKFALDCIKGLVIEDDNLVVRLCASKVYAEMPRTVITVFKLLEK